MASLKFWRKPKTKDYRKAGAALLLPELFEMSQTARRANRLLGAVALFGAFGTVALAVALTPGAQQSASSADVSHAASQAASQQASQAPAEVAVIAPEAAMAEKASEALILVAALPERAAKADRLSRIAWVPQSGSSEHLPDADMRGTVVEAETPAEAAAVPEPDPERDIGPDFALGYPEPPTGATGFEAGDDFRVEPSAAAADDESADEAGGAAGAPAGEEELTQEASLDTGAEAEAEAVKTRSAPVKSDVNLRAGPDNGAKVIKVVPRNSKVEVIGCKFWCEVIYAGKRGFIYKGFIPGAKS